MPRSKAVPGNLNGREANEDEIILKLDRNFSCSSPVGSKLIIMCPITLRVNWITQDLTFIYLIEIICIDYSSYYFSYLTVEASSRKSTFFPGH